jgi:hypothetical protein
MDAWEKKPKENCPKPKTHMQVIDAKKERS